MLPSSGYFKNISCPYFKSGFCCRPHCHYNHVKPVTYIPTPVPKPIIEYRPTPIHELKKLRPLSADESGNKLTKNNTEIIKQDGTYDLNKEKSDESNEKSPDKLDSASEKNCNNKKQIKETEFKKKIKISKKVKSKRLKEGSKDKKTNEKNSKKSGNKESDKKKGIKSVKKKKGAETKKRRKINKSATSIKEENKVDNVKDKTLKSKDESDNSKISSNVETKKDSMLRLDEEWAKVLETPEDDFKPSKKPRIAHKPSEKSSSISLKKPEKLTPAQVMYNRFLIAEKNNTDYDSNTEKKRIAHSSNTLEPMKNSTPKKRPIIPAEFGTKVPLIIRQRYLNTFIDELLEFMNEDEAFVRALTEEKIVYTRCTTKNVYLNLAVNVVKKIRGECRLKKGDAKQIKNKDDEEMMSIGNRKVSHEQILNGPHAKNCSIEKKRTLKKADIGKQEKN